MRKKPQLADNLVLICDNIMHTYDGDILLVQDDFSSDDSENEMGNNVMDAFDPGCETDDSAHTHDGDILLMQDDLATESDVEMENSAVVVKDVSGSDTDDSDETYDGEDILLLQAEDDETSSCEDGELQGKQIVPQDSSSKGERQTPNTGNTDRQHVSLQIDSRPKFNPIRNEDIHMRSSKDSSEEVVCKQDVENIELKNSHIFIHLPNVKEEEKETVAKKMIECYNVNVSEFLNKHVNHVVTNLETFKKSIKLSRKQDVSTMQLTCPQNSRAAQLLLHARKSKVPSKSTSDPVQMAEKFGIKVILLETINLDIFHFPSVREQRIPSTHSVRKLKPPFIKIEDRSRLYKPEVLEMKEWPDIEKFLFDQKMPEKDADARHATKRRMYSKYCELCNCRYTTLKEHLNSSIHKNNAMDDSKWEAVDKLRKKLPTIHEFEESLLQKKHQHQQEQKCKLKEGIGQGC